MAETISDAEKFAEKEVSSIKGPLFHRVDIGTDEVIQKRIDHMKELKCESI
jgi:phosphoribosylamine--glycine ligase